MNVHAPIPPRPTCPPFTGLPSIPALDTLRSRPAWVSWDFVWKADRQKWDKPPINPHTDRNASHSDPSTWGAYDVAASLATRRRYAGVGFVMSPDDGMTGFDLDDCRDPETGALSPLAAKVIGLSETYAEISPSGRGLRLFGLGKVEKTTKCDPAGVEVYGAQRYLTITGQHVPGTPTEIRPAPRTLAALLDHAAKVEAMVVAEKERIANAAAARAQAERPQTNKPATGKIWEATHPKNPFWGNVNDRAFANLSVWVPTLFPSARAQPGTGGYRVTSRNLGRDLEEDLSITSAGAKDFGVADQGDSRGGARTAIGLVMEHGGAATPKDAAFWLCEQLVVDPESLGWQPERQKADAASATATPGDWAEPKPLPSGLLAVQPFDVATIPGSIGPWVADISERMQCPPDFVAVSAMVALGAVLGRKVAVRPQAQTDWFEVPNLWGCIVGRPGAMKSPAMTEALKPLRRLEGEARAVNEANAKAYERAMEAHKIRKEEAGKAARAAMKAGASDIDAILNVEEPEAPAPKRYMTNDVTYESLGVMLATNPNGVLAFRDELMSLLRQLDREEAAPARGFYLSAWNGTSGYTFDRIIRGITHIDAACVSMLGSTQPGRLAEYLTRATRGAAGDDGMVQRFSLLVWPDDSSTWKEVDRFPDSAARQAAWDTFTRLDALTAESVGAVQGEFDALPYLRLDARARGLFSEWRQDLETRLRSDAMHSVLESHFSKYRKLIPTLALLSHLADGEVGAIGEVAMLRALSFAAYLETHARRAYASGLQVEAGTAKAILTRIRKGDLKTSFTTRDVLQKDWSNLSDKASVEAGLALLDDLDWIASRKVDTGGRPKVVHFINPRGLA